MPALQSMEGEQALDAMETAGAQPTTWRFTEIVVYTVFDRRNYILLKPNPDGSEGETGAGLFSRSRLIEASFPTVDANTSFLNEYQAWMNARSMTSHDDFAIQFRALVEKHSGTITRDYQSSLPTVAGAARE